MNNTWRLWFSAIAVLSVVGCGPKLPVNRAPNLVRAELIRADVDAGGAAAGSTGPALVEPTGWATLTGRFVVNGKPLDACPRIPLPQLRAWCVPRARCR